MVGMKASRGVGYELISLFVIVVLVIAALAAIVRYQELDLTLKVPGAELQLSGRGDDSNLEDDGDQ